MRISKALKVKSSVLLTLLLGLFLFNGLIFSQEKPEIAKLEQGLLPSVLIKGEAPWSLLERMRYHKVPGVSIAVIKDFKIQWSKGYGIKDINTSAAVTAETLFQAASCSKPVTALAALKLAQDGKLKLTEDVNEALTSWKLPENEFTKQQKVTLKQLLSHSGGITVHGFRGYESGVKVPTLVEVLEGKEPVNSSPIRVDQLPGSMFRYSGGGFCIVQQMLVDTMKQPFPIIMEDIVLKPLGMTRSTYLQPLPDDRANQAASGHMTSGLTIKGKWHIYPEMAAAGLWTTAEDLARFVAEIQLSLKNKANKVLTEDKIVEMLSPYNSNSMGLGVMIGQRGEDTYFEHGGGNEGYRCFIIGHVNKGYGAVVMTNSDNGDALFKEILRGIAHIYEWQNYLPPVYDVVPCTPEKLKTFVGKYEVDSDHLLAVSEENGHLYGLLTSMEKGELFPVGEGKFVRKDDSAIYEFFTNAETGKASHLEVVRNERRRGFLRVGDEAVVPFELLMSAQLEKAAVGYRQLKAQNAADPNVDATRLLYLTEDLVSRGMIPEGMVLLHLAAEFDPDFIKSMATTLNTEIRMLLDNPSIPEPYKEQIKASYNGMLRKLGLKELE